MAGQPQQVSLCWQVWNPLCHSHYKDIFWSIWLTSTFFMGIIILISSSTNFWCAIRVSGSGEVFHQVKFHKSRFPKTLQVIFRGSVSWNIKLTKMQLSFFAGELAKGGMQQNQCGKIITENISHSDKKQIISVNPRLKDDICKASDFLPGVSHCPAGQRGCRLFRGEVFFGDFTFVCLFQIQFYPVWSGLSAAARTAATGLSIMRLAFSPLPTLPTSNDIGNYRVAAKRTSAMFVCHKLNLKCVQAQTLKESYFATRNVSLSNVINSNDNLK